MFKYYSHGRYALKVLNEDDLQTVAAHRNTESTWSNLSDPLPVLYHQQQKWFENLGTKSMYFIATYDSHGIDMHIGICRITEIDYINSNACVGIDIYEMERKKGHGQQVFNMLVDYCFDVLNLQRLWLLVKEDNVAGIKIYERGGFIKEGVMRKHLYRNGEWYDYILMGGLRSERWHDSTVQS